MALLSALTKAVDELVQFGYPREVAERIVDGTLDMRTDAIIERQQDMFPTTAFHGGGDDIRVVDPNRVTSGKTANTGFFMSSSPVNAASYADRAGNIMPLAVDTRGFDVVNAGGNEWNRIVNPDYLLGGERLATFGELPGYRGTMEPDRGIFDLNVVRDFDTDELARTARRFKSPGLIVKDVQDIGPNYKAFDPAFEAMTGLKLGDEGYQEALDRFSADTIVASDPTRVRSLFAAFDPEYKGSNILGGTAAGALGLTALMAPEEAEAGVVKTFGRAFDPRFDPRVKEQEKLRDTTYTIEERGTQDAPRIPLSDLEGRPFVTTMSDRTQAGGLLTGIDDVALDRPINLQGGQGFMFENPGMVWASAPGVVNQIMRAASEVGDNPVYLPFRMAPTGGDFATMTGETMLSFASSNMNKTQKKALDKAIKDYESVGSMVKGKRVGAGLKIKGWKGVDDPSSVEVWRNTPDTLRKELMNMMDVQFRDQGGLSIGQARLAVTEPGQANALDAQIQNIGEIFTGKDVVQASGHPSYPAGVPGQGLGRTDQEVNIFELLTDARFGGQQKPVGDPLKPTAQEIRALQMKPYTGRITEDTLKALEARGVEIGSADPRLLAALAAGSGAGTLALQDEPVADTAARLKAESDTSGAYAPRSGLLQDVTMAARDLERRLEGSPASLLFPSGYIQHLEEFNRPYERSTYTGALLGALDFL
jgi:hypothetical protein